MYVRFLDNIQMSGTGTVDPNKGSQPKKKI